MPINIPKRQELMDYLHQEHIRFNADKPWTNFMETLEARPGSLTVEVDSEEQVQKLIRKIKAFNDTLPASEHFSVRATAGWADKPDTGCCACLPSFFKACSSKGQTDRYNESFSFSPGSVGDIIIRFSPKYKKEALSLSAVDDAVEPESPILLKRLKKHAVNVPAGMQIKTLADFLEKNNKSLTTVSMIAYVTAIGLALNAGHGTGKDEPSFAGLIRELRICDFEGNIKTIKIGEEDFETLRAAKSGLLGIVLSAKFTCVDGFKLKETVENYPSIERLRPHLQRLMQENHYFTLMHIPTYLHDVIADKIENWHVRLWNQTTDRRTVKGPTYEPAMESFMQELTTKIGSSVQEYLIDEELHHLIPAFMTVAAGGVTALRGTRPIVGKENHITHYQVAFPKELSDLSFLIPVKDGDCGRVLGDHLAKIESLLDEAQQRGEYPVTYAAYVRYFKGTNGGLTTSATTSADERTLAFEVVTNPEAPGFLRFQQALIAYFKEYYKETDITPRYHLGKDIPVSRYEDFLGEDAVSDFRAAMTRFYGSEEALGQSPFITPYFKDMLATGVQVERAHVVEPGHSKAKRQIAHAPEDILVFLNALVKELEKFVSKVEKEAEEARAEIRQAFQQLMEKIEAEINKLEQQLALRVA